MTNNALNDSDPQRALENGQQLSNEVQPAGEEEGRSCTNEICQQPSDEPHEQQDERQELSSEEPRPPNAKKTTKLGAAKQLVQNNSMLWVKVVVFKVGTYVFDIGSDVANGVDYLRGNPLPAEDLNKEEVCADLMSYSHPKWGALTIALTWLPGILYVVGQGAFKQSQGKLTCKMALGYAALAVIWPFLIFGLLLSGLFPNSKKRKFTFCGDVWDYEHALAFKAQEGFLEAAPQMVLQFCLLAQGVNLGPVQIFALCVSFMTLNLTSAEWNYYWFDLHKPTSVVEMLLRAIKVTPFFLLPIIYKTISWALLVSLLGYYTLIVLVVALAYQYAIQRRTGFLPQHVTRGIFYNMCTIARPAAHSTWNTKMAGMFRLDTYGSLLIHLASLCVATGLWDVASALPHWNLEALSFCVFSWFQSYVSVIGRCIMLLGVLNAAVAEAYLTFWPHIVLPTMEEEAVEMTDKKLGWGAERVTYNKQEENDDGDQKVEMADGNHGSRAAVIDNVKSGNGAAVAITNEEVTNPLIINKS